jgi:hypothetical protein
MWKSLKNLFVRVIVAVMRGLVWWIEQLGKNPALSRDHGILVLADENARARPAASRATQAGRDKEAPDEPELPAGELKPAGSTTTSQRSSSQSQSRLGPRPLQRRALRGRLTSRLGLLPFLKARHQSRRPDPSASAAQWTVFLNLGGR